MGTNSIPNCTVSKARASRIYVEPYQRVIWIIRWLWYKHLMRRSCSFNEVVRAKIGHHFGSRKNLHTKLFSQLLLSLRVPASVSIFGISGPLRRLYPFVIAHLHCERHLGYSNSVGMVLFHRTFKVDGFECRVLIS